VEAEKGCHQRMKTMRSFVPSANIPEKKMHVEEMRIWV
jgi:hypothetical protein